MRSITKGAECKELQNWKQLNATSPQNIHYDNLGKAERDPMLDLLIQEQGGLCAYTMKPIAREKSEGDWSAHIEHIRPRGKHPHLSVSWTNIVACVPKGGVACDYGAKLKDNYDPNVKPFVDPTKSGVAEQFRFRENGEVEGLTPAAVASANENVLNLNHPHLVHDRSAKIRGALDRKPTATQARERAKALRTPDRHGMLEPYCEAVAKALEAYALRLENRAKRMSGVKRT